MTPFQQVLLKEYELVNAHYFHEDNRQLAKFVAFLSFNTALITISGIFASNDRAIVLASLGFLAVASNLLFVAMNARGAFYRDVRVKRAHEIEERLTASIGDDTDPGHMIFTHFRTCREVPAPRLWIPSTRAIQVVMMLASITWLVAFVVFVVRAFR